MPGKSGYMKRIVSILFLLIVVLFLPVSASAETRSMEFDITETIGKDAVFSIKWENSSAKADVELVSPSGKVYSEKKTPGAVDAYEGTTLIYVGKAAKGRWKVKAKGNSIGRLSVDAGELPGSMEIEKFKVKKSGDGYVADYKITDAPDEMDLEVYADTDSEGADGQLVWSGHGGDKGKISFSMNALPPGEYHLYLMASRDSTYSYKYSDDVISWQDTGYTYKVTGVQAGKYNDGYYISWDYSEDEDYTVYIWDAGKNLYNTAEITGTGFYYGEFARKQKKVYLAVIYTGTRCNYRKSEVKKASKADAEAVFSIDGDITNQGSIDVQVSYKGKCSWTVYKDDIQAAGPYTEAGNYNISLKDGNNKLYVLVTDQNGNIREFDKELYVDTIAPALSVSEDINKLVTNENYVWLGGYTEAGAELLLNGEKAELEKDYFNIKTELSAGENTLHLVANDKAGNSTEYVAVVTYQPEVPGFSGFIKKYMWIIALCVLAVFYIISFTLSVKKKQRKDKAK